MLNAYDFEETCEFVTDGCKITSFTYLFLCNSRLLFRRKIGGGAHGFAVLTAYTTSLTRA